MESILYSFREMYKPDFGKVWYVIHDQTGCTLPYNNGKVSLTSNPPHYKAECFAAWYALSRNARKRAKQAYIDNKRKLNKMSDCGSTACGAVTLGDFARAREALLKASVPLAGNTITFASLDEACSMDTKGNKKMFHDEDIDYSADAAKGRIRSRLYDEYYEKRTALAKHFNRDDDEAPKTPTEFLQRIKDGKFTVPSEEEWKGTLKMYPWYSFSTSHITWRDPAKPFDKDGLKAAEEKLENALEDALDTVAVSEPKEALEAFRAFRAQTFH